MVKRLATHRIGLVALLMVACLVGSLGERARPAAAQGAGGEPCEGIPGAVLETPFDANYSCRSLGAPPGVPDRTAASRLARPIRIR